MALYQKSKSLLILIFLGSNTKKDTFLWSMHAGMYVCIYVCMHACIYVCMYVRTYVRTYVCMYVCMYVCTVQTFDFFSSRPDMCQCLVQQTSMENVSRKCTRNSDDARTLRNYAAFSCEVIHVSVTMYVCMSICICVHMIVCM